MSTPGGSDAVDEFLELEQELSTGTKSSKTYEQGNIAKAAKIPSAEVPDDYPVRIRTQQALHLDVETPDGETVATYLEWPAEDEDSDHVERLLDALGRSHDEFANVYGDRVALEAEDGWHGIDPERTAAMRGARLASEDGSLDTTRKLLTGAVGAGLLAIPASALSESLAGLLLVLSWIGIPAGIYLDSNRVADATNWSPKTDRWVLGGLLPLLNYSVGLAYLLDRHVRHSERTFDGGSKLWYRSIFACFAAIPVAFIVGNVAEATAGMVLFLGWTFLPFAVYFDARYVENATNWDPNEKWWTVATIFLGLVGAVAYLAKRYAELD